MALLSVIRRWHFREGMPIPRPNSQGEAQNMGQFSVEISPHPGQLSAEINSTVIGAP
jgi:hypothetical protein